MTTANAIAVSQNEIVEILTNAGLVDGEQATTQQVKNNILFWDSVLKSKVASDTQIYAIWSLVSTNKKSNADNMVNEREAFVAIDIFTRRQPSTATIQNLISEIENQALNKQWTFEFDGPVDYEIITAIYHLNFNLTKILI